MRNITRLMMLFWLTLLAGAVPAWAQASGSMAEVRGQVTDNTGAVIPNAKVTLTDLSKGTARTATTDAEGNYTFIGLLPSTYELKTEASQFATSLTKFDLTVGQQANVPVKLTAGKVEASIDVVAGTEVVETQRTEQSSTVEARQINNLPINRRNFLDYALLTPGVADADNIADSSDFRVAQTPQSGLSFGGNNGRGNMVQVDGAETLGSSGGVQATLSQEGVQEFQVIRNSYSAEFGGASGGVVNIVSKSGRNKFFGSAFGLFRDKVFDARNAFDFNPDGQSPFNRQQYGGSLGGPIKQDKTFFFTAVERYSQDRTAFINLLSDPNNFLPTNGQQGLLNFLGANSAFAPLVTQARVALTTTAQVYPRTVNLFTSSSGQFPFEEGQTQFSARLDHNFSDRSSGYLRFNVTDGVFENQAAGALTAVSRGRLVDIFNGGVVASHNYQISPTTLNELKLQYSYTRSGFFTNDPFGPEINIEGFGFFGRDIFLPSESIERHYDIYDNFTKIVGNHTLKLGGSLLSYRLTTTSETFFGGRFNFTPQIPLAAPLQSLAGAAAFGQVNSYLRACAPPATTPPTPVPAYCGTQGPLLGVDANGNGVADSLDAPLTSVQAFNFNLPAVYQQGFGDASANSWTARYSLYAQDTWKLRPNFTLNYGLRYSIHDEPFFIPTYKKDFQPRASFSWDPWGDGKTAIRGGAGIFTGFLNNAVANVTTELSGMGDPGNINIVLATATSNALGLPTSIAVYQTLLSRGVIGTRAITLADVSAPPLNINPRPGAPLEVRFRLGPDYRNPTTYQASFGVERDLGKGFSAELSYLYSRGIHIARNRDVNQFKQTGPLNPLNPLGGPTFIRFPTAAQVAAGLTSDFRNPLIFQDNVYETTANSFYHAFTAQVEKRFANNFSLNAHYTLAKAIDEVTDFNSDFSAQNPLNLRLDRSLSAFDQRHRFVASAVVQSSFENIILRDWVVSPILVAQSGRPFNLLLGFDANNDGRSQSDRPGPAGRNTAKGESYYSFDMRLARRFFVKENRYLEITVEGFNLFNRTNFLGINNVIGGACVANGLPVACTTGATPLTDFNLRGRADQKPTAPLGFTSAADPRQLQFGARFNF